MESYLFFSVVLSIVYHTIGLPQDAPNVPIPLDECVGKSCGEECGGADIGVCNGDGICVSPLENPCAIHGCQGLECGESCLSGDIVGVCNVAGECVEDIRSVTTSGECRSQCKRFGQTCGPGPYGDEGECCYEKGLTCIGSSTLAPGAQSTCGVCEDHVNWTDELHGEEPHLRCKDLTLEFCNNQRKYKLDYIIEARKNCPKSCGICY